MNRDLSSKRKEYKQNSIDFLKLPSNPFEYFNEWYYVAESSNLIDEPNAFTLSTVDETLQPKSRIVLLKEYNKEGFVFYTNYKSQKAQNIDKNNRVSMSFFWKELERQVIIYGNAFKVSVQQSDAYFYKRPIGSQIGANLSKQSKPIPLDFDVDKAYQELKEKYETTEIKRPEHWGGYLIKPNTYEFWQGRPSRLHNRVRYTLKSENKNWNLERLWA